MFAIDLFSGCGGLTVGLKKAGFEVVAAVENDKLAASVFKLNHPQTHLIEEDISKVSPSELRRKLKLRKGSLDLLAGCPPCQGFSTLRTFNGAKHIEEPMNDLLFQFLDFVDEFKPKSIMMENVPGLAKDYRIVKFDKHLTELGYDTCFDVLDAANYGVPQHRRRTVFLASKVGKVSHAKPSKKKKTVFNAIGKLPAPNKSRDTLHNYKTNRSAKIEELISRIPKDGGSRLNLPEHLILECHKKTNGFKDVYGRIYWQKPGPTMTGGCINPSRGRFLHPDQNRAITLREASLIQGFPRNYKFDISKGRYPVAQLIGNAFPPAFAAAHAKQLAKLIIK